MICRNFKRLRNNITLRLGIQYTDSSEERKASNGRSYAESFQPSKVEF